MNSLLSFFVTDMTLARGTPMSPGACLVVGILITLAGLANVVIACLPHKSFKRFNYLRSKDGERTPRVILLPLATFFVAFGSFMVADGYFHAVHFSPLPYFGGAFGLILGGVFLETFMSWKRRRFPVLKRCPQCARALDFRINGMSCPTCGRVIE